MLDSYECTFSPDKDGGASGGGGSSSSSSSSGKGPSQPGADKNDSGAATTDEVEPFSEGAYLAALALTGRGNSGSGGDGRGKKGGSAGGVGSGGVLTSSLVTTNTRTTTTSITTSGDNNKVNGAKRCASFATTYANRSVHQSVKPSITQL